MNSDFRKPFTAPPVIFIVSLLPAFVVGVVAPLGILPIWAQLVFGPVFLLAGVWLIRNSMREIKSAGSTYDPFALTTALTTSGIYQYTRNPGYLGLAEIQIGLALLLDNVWIAVAAIVAGAITTIMVIKLEEEKLLNSFGEPYRQYCARVRRWL